MSVITRRLERVIRARRLSRDRTRRTRRARARHLHREQRDAGVGCSSVYRDGAKADHDRAGRRDRRLLAMFLLRARGLRCRRTTNMFGDSSPALGPAAGLAWQWLQHGEDTRVRADQRQGPALAGRTDRPGCRGLLAPGSACAGLGDDRRRAPRAAHAAIEQAVGRSSSAATLTADYRRSAGSKAVARCGARRSERRLTCCEVCSGLVPHASSSPARQAVNRSSWPGTDRHRQAPISGGVDIGSWPPCCSHVPEYAAPPPFGGVLARGPHPSNQAARSWCRPRMHV